MHKSKLLELFGFLEKDELREFEKFVSSPFFNKDQKVVDLYNYIRKYYDNLDSPKLTKQHFIKKAYKTDQALGNRRINYLMSDLTKLIEDYWLWKELDKMELARERLMLKTYKERKVEKQFFNYFERLRQYHQKRKKRGSNYYYHEFSINHDVMLFIDNIKGAKEEDYLPATSASLDAFYCVTKLRYILEMIFLNSNSIRDYQIPDLELILNLANQEGVVELPLFQIYWRLINFLKSPTEENYQKLKPFVIEHFDELEKEDQFDTIVAMLNTTYLNYVKSSKRWGLVEAFELYKFALEKEFFLVDGKLSSNLFNNVTSLGCQLQEFDWLKQFFVTYSVQLKEEERENLMAYNQGFLAVHMKQYEEAIDYMRVVEFDKKYLLVAKSLLLRCYYELRDYEVFYYDYCKAYEQFLRRSKDFPKNKISTYLSFIQIARKLHKSKLTRSKDNSKLLVEIEGFDKEPALKKWLLEKWEEID